MDLAESLNLHCACTTLQPPLLAQALAGAAPDLARAFDEDRPHLFSASPVFLAQRDAVRIAQAVGALHRVAHLPAHARAALADAGDATKLAFGPTGAFMGYDFHVGAEGPRLIEINTNAGGALLHAAAAQAHRGCCESQDRAFPFGPSRTDFEAAVLAMFQAEWRSQRGDAPLTRVAIVDEAPAGQYLAPEFELARALFERAGIAAVIADPSELQHAGGALWHGGERVDLVYNRLTDFALDQAGSAALRGAYAAGDVVLTPHPRAHALQADKRNLAVFGDAERLTALGASEDDVDLLAQTVPQAQAVTAENADALWARRRDFFFKPFAGFGSRGAYRGDKLTRKVWAQIAAGGYLAQALVAPGERIVPQPGGAAQRLRLDVRAYAYAGEVLLLAARVYLGQTTNFRTPGGGFAPVVLLPSTLHAHCAP